MIRTSRSRRRPRTWIAVVAIDAGKMPRRWWSERRRATTAAATHSCCDRGEGGGGQQGSIFSLGRMDGATGWRAHCCRLRFDAEIFHFCTADRCSFFTLTMCPWWCSQGRHHFPARNSFAQRIAFLSVLCRGDLPHQAPWLPILSACQNLASRPPDSQIHFT